MRKSILSCVGLLLSLGLILPACDQGATEVPQERVPIRWFVGLGPGTGPEAQVVEAAFVEQFNASQDEIELVLDVAPGGGVFVGAEALQRRIDAGDPPDVVGPTGTIGLDQFSDIWMDLEPLLRDTDIDTVNPAVIGTWRVEGRLSGLPTGVNPAVIYYNRDLFDAASLPYPPRQYGEPYADGDLWTIEKMEELAMRLTIDAAGNEATSPDFDPDAIVQWGFHWQWESGTGLANLFGPGPAVDESGSAAIPEHWREAYHWYYDGMWEDHFIPNANEVKRLMDGNSFASGRVAMAHSYLWYLPRLTGASFEWNVAAVPSYVGTVTVDWSSSMVGVLSTSEHPREAAQVAYALATSPELLALWVTSLF